MPVTEAQSSVTVVLPVPPNANHYYTIFRGRKILSAEARRWKAGVAGLLYGRKPISGPVSMTLRWYRASKTGDLDGRIKATQDILTGVLYEDDKQIVELHAYRSEDKHNPRIEVEVKGI